MHEITRDQIQLAILLMLQSPFLHGLLLAVLLDICTGFAKAFITKKVDSRTGLNGIIKHAMIVILILMVNPYMIILGYRPYFQTFILFFVLTYGISILENLDAMGVPMPGYLKDFFIKMRKAADDKMKDPKNESH